MRKVFLYLLPITIGVLGAIFVRAITPVDLSPDICQWVYSTIIQAFAAMVALIGMFAIYTLQFLTHRCENDVKELVDSIRHREKEEMNYRNMRKERLKKSLDFINEDGAIENERKEIVRNEEFIGDEEQKIYNRGREETIGCGNKRTEINSENAKKLMRLDDWEWAVEDEKRVLDRFEREKDTTTRIKKEVKIPLIASGFLIGISFFLLSFSTQVIIHGTPSVFLWLFAGTTGAAVCLTYMLITVILGLIRI